MLYGLLEQRRKGNAIKWLATLLLLVALGVGIWFTYAYTHKDLKEQGVFSVRNAVLDSAKQCCAVEGSYPSSLRYLEENYGLIVNHDSYSVLYESFAENVMPNVVVIPR